MTQPQVDVVTSAAKSDAKARNGWTLLQVLVGVLTGPEVIDQLNAWFGTHMPAGLGVVFVGGLAAVLKNFIAVRVGDRNTSTFKKPTIEVPAVALEPAPAVVPTVPVLDTAPVAVAPVAPPTSITQATPPPYVPPFSVDLQPPIPREGIEGDSGEANLIEPPMF